MWLIYDFLVIPIGYRIYQCISIFSRWNINFIITLLNQYLKINWFPWFNQLFVLHMWSKFAYVSNYVFGIHSYIFLLKYMLGLLLILISKSWACTPHPPHPPSLWARHAFHRQRQMHKREGGAIFIFARVFFPIWCHTKVMLRFFPTVCSFARFIFTLLCLGMFWVMLCTLWTH